MPAITTRLVLAALTVLLIANCLEKAGTNPSAPSAWVKFKYNGVEKVFIQAPSIISGLGTMVAPDGPFLIESPETTFSETTATQYRTTRGYHAYALVASEKEVRDTLLDKSDILVLIASENSKGKWFCYLAYATAGGGSYIGLVDSTGPALDTTGPVNRLVTGSIPDTIRITDPCPFFPRDTNCVPEYDTISDISYSVPRMPSSIAGRPFSAITTTSRRSDIYYFAVYGKVFDAATLQPLAEAIVQTPNNGVTLADTTDATGAYRLNNLTPGQHKIVCSAPGYQYEFQVTEAVFDSITSTTPDVEINFLLERDN